MPEKKAVRIANRGKLKRRSAKDWENIIEEKVPEYAKTKIALLVFWDYIDASGSRLTMSPWLRGHLDGYNHTKHDLCKEDLFRHLKAIGYSDKNADAKRPASAAINARAATAEKKREELRMANYENKHT